MVDPEFGCAFVAWRGLPDGKDPTEASGDQRLVGALGIFLDSPVGENEISTIEAAKKDTLNTYYMYSI